MIQRNRALLAVLLLAAIFHLAMMPLVLRHLQPVTGDEPFYIMTAISIVRDQDLDETNNYQQRDYDEFYPAEPLPADWRGWPSFPRTLPPHPAIAEQDGLYSKHGLGLSLLIAVPYQIAGREGAIFVVMLCALLLAAQMFFLAREAGTSYELAAAIALGMSISMPLAPYASLIFPEIPAALLIIYALRRITSSQNQMLQWIATGSAVGFLPWLHQRFALVSVVFAVAIVYRLLRERSFSIATALVPVAAGGFGLLAYNQWLYGQPTQNVDDHAGFSGLSGTVNGAAGLMLDAQWGLLVVAPFLIFAIAAIPHWLQRDRTRALMALATITPYIAVVAAYQVWWGEWGPPARYLVPIVPLLAGPLGAWISSASRNQRIAAVGLWLFGMLLTLIGYAQPQRFYHHPDGVNKLYQKIDESLRLELSSWLSAFQPYAVDAFMTRLVWTTGSLLVLIGVFFWVNLPRQDGGVRNTTESGN